MWGSADTTHTQWQVPGQTLGQESGLITSVKVNWRPGPSCRHGGRLLYNWQQCLMWAMPLKRNDLTINRDELVCRWSAYGIIFSAASLAWRSWERVNPTASTTARLCLWFWTHRNIKRDMLTSQRLTLRGTSSGLREIRFWFSFFAKII